MTDKPRLIEVAFPLKQASLASVHEKNVRHGHISTLHIWPARRPLAASRAALLATLLPDPGDARKRQELLDMIGGTVVKKLVTSEDDDGNTVSEEKEVVEGGVLVWGNENDAAMDTLRAAIKKFYGGIAPRVLDPFAGGGAIPLEAMRLGCEVTSADLNPVAWFIQKCTLDYPQRFAGMKWPLPEFVREWPDFVEDFIAGKIKKRKGDKRPHFTDAKQIQLLALPDADLAWHVRAWGRWVLERARQELAARYPVVDGEPTVAYLWARTARDPESTGRIPLLKTFWLCKKKGRQAALLPVPTRDGSGVTFKLLRDADLNQPDNVIEQFDFLRQWEVTADNLDEFLKNGTMNRAGVWSPCSGRPGVVALTMEDLRRQGQQGLLGEQMTAVVVERAKPSKRGTFKYYRLPTDTEIVAANVEPESLDEVFTHLPGGMLEEQLPPPGTLGFRVNRYGFTRWRHLFCPRQLLSLGIFSKNLRLAVEQLKGSHLESHSPGFSQAIAGQLVCGFDRMLDFNSNIVSWIISVEAIGHTFARFALPMCWDFSESAMINECRGGWSMCLEATLEAAETAGNASHKSVLPPQIVRRSALKTPSDALAAVVTDPPYYDAIPYSDLMDYFYIWNRRALSGLFQDWDENYQQSVSPKWNDAEADGELIEDESRHGGDKAKAKAAYETGMAGAFEAQLKALGSEGRLVVVFANKSVDAWETLVGSLIRAGAEVVASWPIQTEQAARMRAQSSAALSSSVWIVCRKRSATAPAGWEEPVLERMKLILFDRREELGGINILQYYFDLGIRGPDFIWAALGPALQAYSEHPFVKKTAGGVMTVREFLDQVRRLVLQFSLGELPGFHELQSVTQGRGETVELDPVTQYYLLHRAYFGLTPAPAGACILYANACGKNETELKVVWNILEQGGKSGPGKKGRPRKDEADEGEDEAESTSSGNEYRLLDWSERVEPDDLGESKAGQPAPLIDKLHRLMTLFQRNQAADVQRLYDEWGLASERAFPPLLQAIRELALEDRNDMEKRLVESLASQLKLTRRQVVEAGVLKDEPFFPAIDESVRASVNYRKAKK